MSRYTITVTVTVTGHGMTDTSAVIGYDTPLQTFFLRAFPDDEGEDLALWLGMDFREFETLTTLRAAANAAGCDFLPVLTETLCKLIDDGFRFSENASNAEDIETFLKEASRSK